MDNKNKLFHFTIFKKDLIRFTPLWALYLAVGLLLTVSNISSKDYLTARYVIENLSVFGLFMFVYALMTAQLLFGELCQSRLCNAIHALPVRREGLFFTHFVSGMVIGIGPNLIMALVSMMAMGKLWFIAPLCLLAVALMFLAFFCLAIFSMMCTGNRFAGVLIYALINFVSLLVMWYFELFYLPLLYGLEMNDATRSIFRLFSPVVHMAYNPDWITIQHNTAICTAPHYIIEDSYLDVSMECQYIFTGLGESWIYLVAFTVIALFFGVAALLLYRKRNLEDAGDFVSFKPMSTVFTLLASAGMGLLFYYIAAEVLVGLFIGLFIGFFVCQMLLQRSLRVFGKFSWIKLGALYLVIVLTLGMTYVDIGGVAHRIPDQDQIQSVTIADHYLSQYRLEQITMEQREQNQWFVETAVDPSYEYAKDGQMTLTEAKDIEKIMKIHSMLIDEGDARKNGDYTYTITIHYVLKNGTTLTRYYHPAMDSEAMKLMAEYTYTPQFILGYYDQESMLKSLNMVTIYYEDGFKQFSDRAWKEKMVTAIFADVQAGNFNRQSTNAFELDLEYLCETGSYDHQYLTIPETASYTIAWLKEYLAWWNESVT